ncbi:MAG: hypothetical protein ACREHG_10590 [Candidatus Saccharimonadales bacterium]
MAVTDITPMTWTNSVADLTDTNFNTEIRDSYLLQLNPPACGLQRTTNLTLVTSTWTAVGFDTLLYDTLSDDTAVQWASGANSKITARCDGWYECVASARIVTPTSAMEFTAAFRINGTDTWFGGSQNCPSSPVTTQNVTVANLLQLSSGDYVELVLWQDAGSNNTVTATGLTPGFSMIRRRGI